MNLFHFLSDSNLYTRNLYLFVFITPKDTRNILSKRYIIFQKKKNTTYHRPECLNEKEK